MSKKEESPERARTRHGGTRTSDAIREVRDVWKEVEVIKDVADVAIQHLYGQKKKRARRVVDKARKEMEEERF